MKSALAIRLLRAAEGIEDTIMCRFLWDIPMTADVREEANRILDPASGVCRDYFDVAGELSFLFVREVASV